MIMMKCWARSLGNCAGKLSREHLFSGGLFDQPQIIVSGYPWCKGEAKVVGVDAVTSKILCEAHNNALSPVDKEASEFIRQLSIAADLHLERRSQREPGGWDIYQTLVDGPLLERWFLKTAVNLSLAGRSELRWHLTDSQLKEVPDPFVHAAFGNADLPEPMGLYAVVSVGVPQKYEFEVSFAPTLKAGTHIVGGSFNFRGLQYLLWLEDRPVPDPPIPVLRRDWANPQTIFHLSGMDFGVQGHDSHAITYRWATPRNQGMQGTATAAPDAQTR
jgi:hypothetical protein